MWSFIGNVGGYPINQRQIPTDLHTKLLVITIVNSINHVEAGTDKNSQRKDTFILSRIHFGIGQC
jgi:hypothetical protein